MRVIIYLLWSALVACLTFPTAILSIVKPNSLKEAKTRLMNSIRLSWPQVTENAFLDLSDKGVDSVIFPKELMSEEALEALGLHNLFNVSSYFSLEDGSIRSPRGVRPIFVFNSTNIPDSASNNVETIMESIVQNPPFTVGTSLKDFFLTVPKADLELENMRSATRSVLSSLIIGASSSILPVWSQIKNSQEPSIIFVFDAYNSTNTPFEGVHSDGLKYIDCIARSWINEQGLPNFLSSFFCNVNPEKKGNAYCLDFADPVKVRYLTWSKNSTAENSDDNLFENEDFDQQTDDEDVLNLRTRDKDPGYSESEKAKLNRSETFDAQVFKQLRRKYIMKASKLDRGINFLYDDPKAFIDEFDDKLDYKLRMIARQIERTGQKIEDTPKEMKRTVESELEKLAIKVLSETDPNLLADNDDDEEDDESNPYANIHYKRNDIGDTDSPLKPHWSNKTIGTDTSAQSDQVELFLPMSIVKAKLQPCPRTNGFRQILFQAKDDLEKHNKRKETCVPITWYNVFHYSIFGTANFCV